MQNKNLCLWYKIRHTKAHTYTQTHMCVPMIASCRTCSNCKGKYRLIFLNDSYWLIYYNDANLFTLPFPIASVTHAKTLKCSASKCDHGSCTVLLPFAHPTQASSLPFVCCIHDACAACSQSISAPSVNTSTVVVPQCVCSGGHCFTK